MWAEVVQHLQEGGNYELAKSFSAHNKAAALSNDETFELWIHGTRGAECWGTKHQSASVLYYDLIDGEVGALVEALLKCFDPEEGRRLNSFRLTSQLNLGDPSMVFIGTLFEDTGIGLTELDLTSCGITPEGCEELVASLDRGVGSATLESLSLGWNPIGRKGGQAVAGFLQRSSAMRILNIPSCDLELQPLVEVISVVEAHEGLLELDISKPIISGRQDTARHIARMLSRNATLETLKATSHRIGDEGAQMISKALQRNRAVTHLDLSSNKIGITGGEALASALIGGSEIKHFILSNNSINDHGAFAFCDVISRTSTLHHLDLRNNSISESGLLAVATSMSDNASLQKLQLWGNHFEVGVRPHKPTMTC